MKTLLLGLALLSSLSSFADSAKCRKVSYEDTTASDFEDTINELAEGLPIIQISITPYVLGNDKQGRIICVVRKAR